MMQTEFVGTTTARDLVFHIKEIISTYSGLSANNIKLRDNLRNDLRLDSLDVVDLSANVEHELKIYLPEDLSKIKNVKALVAECIKRVQSKKLKS